MSLKMLSKRTSLMNELNYSFVSKNASQGGKAGK
jgi:hypothetical protein